MNLNRKFSFKLENEFQTSILSKTVFLLSDIELWFKYPQTGINFLNVISFCEKINFIVFSQYE